LLLVPGEVQLLHPASLADIERAATFWRTVR